MRRLCSTKENLTLAGTRILVVEDEVLLALELELALSCEGAEIVGPCYTIPQLRENPKTPLAKRRDPDSTERMIRPGFLDIESRQNLIELARDGSAVARRSG